MQIIKRQCENLRLSENESNGVELYTPVTNLYHYFDFIKK